MATVSTQMKANGQKQISAAKAKKLMTERAYRAEKAAKIWNTNSLFAGKLDNLSESQRHNLAIGLTNQARLLDTLSEEQVSTVFKKMAPANLMRLVQMTMPNLNRGNVFAEYSMESMRDAIFYIRPFFNKPFGHEGETGSDYTSRARGYDQDSLNEATAANKKLDPFGFSEAGDPVHNFDGSYDWNQDDFRRALYESTEDRHANELDAIRLDDNFEGTFDKGAFKNGYIDGYTYVFVTGDENDVVAQQDSSTGKFYITRAYKQVIESVKVVNDKITVKFAAGKSLSDVEGLTSSSTLSAVGRFDSEKDYTGEHLGEVELKMSVFELRPQRTSIGVTWTKLAEISLDTTFNTSVDELLLSYAADTIKTQMDYRAFREAYAFARTNPDNYVVEFDAAYATDSVEQPGTKDGYVDNAQTFSSAVATLGDVMYNDIQRGEITHMVCGLSAGTYLKLNAGFSPKGAQNASGVYRFGELDGIPLFKAPTSVIPSDEILCVYKNDRVDNDVALVYGTLIPFTSTQLDYPTQYSRAGLATYGDRALLNKRYLGIIRIKNMKDSVGVKVAKKTTNTPAEAGE